MLHNNRYAWLFVTIHQHMIISRLVIELGLKMVLLHVACNINEWIKTEGHISHPAVQVALVLSQTRLAQFDSQWHHNWWGWGHIVQPFHARQRQQCDPLWFSRWTLQTVHRCCGYETVLAQGSWNRRCNHQTVPWMVVQSRRHTLFFDLTHYLASVG